jgi:hypothetical protein
MNHTFKNKIWHAGISLAVVAVFSAFGNVTAQAATFNSADISIEQRGDAAGGATCTWRETGLGDSQVVYYACSGDAVGALKACTYKNRVIYNSPSRLDIFKNVTGEDGAAVAFLSQRNGQISASTTVAIPHVEVAPGTELCTAPSVEEVVAVRWCNTSLTDTTNNLVGARVAELFQPFFSDVGTVPTCAELLVSP